MEKTKYIAHRGFALKNMENTIQAFEYAAKSTAFGIETDVHLTKDKKFVCFHDDNTLRLCGKEYIIEDTNFQDLANLKIDNNHKIPTLDEYIEICKSGNKIAVVELKNPFIKSDIDLLIQQIQNQNYLNNTTFISFDLQNVLYLRKKLPAQPLQFITITYDEKVLKQLAKQRIVLDIKWTCLSKQRVEFCHSLGLKVNCWTLNDAKIAKHFDNCGIDYITSNILEKA